MHILQGIEECRNIDHNFTFFSSNQVIIILAYKEANMDDLLLIKKNHINSGRSDRKGWRLY